MESLIEHIEQNLDQFDDRIYCLNEFQDDDLAMYPAIAIKEVDLTAQECETIAKNISIAINAADNEDSMSKPARALVALAYNSLMDPGRGPKQTHSASEKPLFHKDEFKVIESWLRICEESDLDLRDYLVDIEPSFEVFQLKLLRPDASNFDRKASIGAWAYRHLKLMGHFKEGLWSKPCEDYFHRTVEELYGFRSAYRFPNVSRQSYPLLEDKFVVNKSGEVLYLLYRSMIIFENRVFENHGQQLNPIEKLVFGHPRGLSAGRLWLWNWCKRAASRRNLNNPCDHVATLLDIAFSRLSEGPRYYRFTSSARNRTECLREFIKKYIWNSRRDPKKSRYFKYARLVNHFYFDCLELNANQELVGALMYVVENLSGDKIHHRPIGPPWRKLGDEIGRHVLNRKRALDSLLASVERCSIEDPMGDNGKLIHVRTS